MMPEKNGGDDQSQSQCLDSKVLGGFVDQLKSALHHPCAQQIVENEWVVVYVGETCRCFRITVHGGIGDGDKPVELEVEVNGDVVGGVRVGGAMRVEGRKIRVRAKCHAIVYCVEECR